MRIMPTIAFSSPNSPPSLLPTSGPHLEVRHYRRCAHAYSTHTENSSRS